MIRENRDRGGPQVLAIAQGVYYASTGLWPLVHMRSFEAVTGHKTDTWLVRTVASLLVGIGGALVSAGVRGAVTPESAALAMSSAASLGAVDAVYGASGRISKVYLLDAAVEALLLMAWIDSLMSSSRGLQSDTHRRPVP
jgi:hypothetical protein